MLKKRGAGVLLHISSMPSDYGVGVFDENVIHFIDKIADMGFTYWQVLPFNPIDKANSPYCSPSAFAGNYIFINPKGLYDMGLICDHRPGKLIHSGIAVWSGFPDDVHRTCFRKKTIGINRRSDIGRRHRSHLPPDDEEQRHTFPAPVRHVACPYREVHK